MHGSYHVSVIQFISPTPLPLPKKYVELISITVDNYWKSSFLLTLMSFACCHISVNGFTPSKVRPVMWLFLSKLLIHSSFFLIFFYSIITVTIFIFDNANHSRKKMKSPWVQWVSFHVQIAYRLKTEALFVLSNRSISWYKSNRYKRDEHWGWRFPSTRVKCFISGCSNPSLVIKVWRAKLKYSQFF